MKLGKYNIEQELHKGQDSTVYLARHETLPEKLVAIKTGNRERLQLEAKILQELQHSHIIRIEDADFGTQPYIALEHGEQTLRDKIPSPSEQAVEYVRQTLEGLAHAHTKGIIHRDIKPENIILVKGQVKIADWDIATTDNRANDDITNTLKTYKTETRGTPAYMSPEQLQGQTTTASDIYSIGIILYELITGQRPTIAYKPASQTTQSPEWIDTIIQNMLQPEPTKRPTTEDILRYAVMKGQPRGNGNAEQYRIRIATAHNIDPSAPEAQWPTLTEEVEREMPLLIQYRDRVGI